VGARSSSAITVSMDDASWAGNVSGANAGNYTTTTAYNADGAQTSVTQGNGTGYTDTPRETQYGYDGDGNQATVTDARGYTTTTAYNADNQATTVKNPDGDVTLTCYDGDGNAAQTVPPVGMAANSLTAASCPTAYPSGYSERLAADATVSTFNATGDMTAQTTPNPAGQTSPAYQTTSYTYDGNGNLLTTTAPPTSNTTGAPDQVTTDTYNTAGQLASQTTGYGTSAASTTSYCYDPDGDETSVVYGDGNTGVTYSGGTVTGLAACSTSSPWTVTASPQAAYQTVNSYDSAGELVSTVTPANSVSSNPTTTNTYNAAGQMLTRTDPDGITTTWSYGIDGNVIGISYSGGTAPSVSYGYDASGQMTYMSDGTGASNYVFDSFGELTSAENGAGQTVTYGYNADGDVTGVTYPLPSTATWATSDTVSYGYDDAEQLTSVTDFNGHEISIGRTADGLPDSVILGASGDTIATTYDNTDNPSAITLKNSSSTLQSFAYSDSPAGTILSETDTPSSSNSPADYTYDAQGRVTSTTPGSGTTKNYGFDASGDLTTLPTGASGCYNAASELTGSGSSCTSPTATYTYNTDGEQLTAAQGSTNESTATWNGAQQLATYSNSAASMTAATYNGNGVRMSTTITPSGGSAVSQDYVWNTIPSVPQLMMDDTNAYIYTTSNTPGEQVNLSTGTITYLVTDSLGSVRGTVSSSGALTDTTSYDAWGNPETAGGLSATTPFGYAGGYTDPDGLIYLLNRYYQPATGQFISVDPDISQTMQAYAYANNDPVTTYDPAGLSPTVHVPPPGCTQNCSPNPPPNTPPSTPPSEPEAPHSWLYKTWEWKYDFQNDYRTTPWTTPDAVTDTKVKSFNDYALYTTRVPGVTIDGCKQAYFVADSYYTWNNADYSAPDGLSVKETIWGQWIIHYRMDVEGDHFWSYWPGPTNNLGRYFFTPEEAF
jgi:RHS repeat-associated protein